MWHGAAISRAACCNRRTRPRHSNSSRTKLSAELPIAVLTPCHRFVVSPFTTAGAVANAAPLRLGWTPPAPALSAFAPPFEDCGNGGVTIESFAKAAPPMNNACPPSKIRQWNGMRLAPKIIRFTKLLIVRVGTLHSGIICDGILRQLARWEVGAGIGTLGFAPSVPSHVVPHLGMRAGGGSARAWPGTHHAWRRASDGERQCGASS